MDHLNIPSLDGLLALGKDGVDIQPTLLRVVTDLYVLKPRHSDDEERHYTELALRLIELVDAPTRAIVADKLAVYPATPPVVLQRLGRRPAAVAPAAAVAPTPAAEAVIAAATPTPQILPPAPSIVARSPAAELSELFRTATADERRLILLNLDYAPTAPAAPLTPPAAQDAIRHLESAALAHNSETMAQDLERSLAIPRALARRLIEDGSGEPIVVIARALDMPADALQRILLCLNPAVSRSIRRVYELTALHRDIAADSALRMVAIWRAAEGPVRRETQHQTVHAADDTRARAQSAPRPVIRWEEYGREAKAKRS